MRLAAESCPACGYTAETALRNFPFEAEHLERFVDPQGRINAKTRREANRALNELRREFPQVRPYIFVARLPPNIDVREFGFWLFNRSAPANKKEKAERPWGLLFVFDRTSRSASLTAGYAIEPFLGHDELKSALTAARDPFVSGHYGKGIAAMVRELKGFLRTSHQKAAEELKRWKRNGMPEVQPAPAPAPSSERKENVRREQPESQKQLPGENQSDEELELPELTVASGQKKEW